MYRDKVRSKKKHNKMQETIQQNRNNKSGITLVALVLTIIIIIILATVAMNFLLGENGLITKTQQAAEMSEIESVREKLEIAKGTAVIDGQGYIDPDNYFDIIEADGIIENKDTDVIDNGDGTYEVTTVEGYIFIITLLPTPEEVKDLEIEYDGRVDELRIKKIEITDKTTNSITINVDARNADGATYIYSYKLDEETSWKEADTSKNNTCKIEGLLEGKLYNVKVRVEKSEEYAEKEVSVLMGEVPEGTITFGDTKWKGDGTASIVINNSAEGYQLQYQINAIEDNGWRNIDSGGTVEGLTYPSTVYARIFDGTNGSEHASASLEDKIAPSVNVTSTGTTSNSVSVSVAATDAESGMVESPTYTYSIKESSQPDSSYTTPENASNLTTNSYTFTGLTQGTNYTVRVQVNGDKANNIGSGILANQTTGTVGGATGGLTEGNIVASSPTWSNGQASITLTTSVAGMQIQYQKNSTTGSWTTISSGGQVTGLNHNDTVYARLWDGTNAGDYASVTIKDGTAPTISSFTATNTTTNSITVQVSASDGESGLATSGRYKYYLNNSLKATNNSSSYTYTGLADNTTYTLKVVVTDNAGNEKTSSNITQKTLLDNTAPVISSTSFSSKTTSSITIRATATDADNDRITYKLYTSTSSSSGFTQKASTSAASGTQVTLTASGLSQYTTYYYYVEASDGYETKKGSTSSVRTYCPGTGLTCNGPFQTSRDCTACNRFR